MRKEIIPNSAVELNVRSERGRKGGASAKISEQTQNVMLRNHNHGRSDALSSEHHTIRKSFLSTSISQYFLPTVSHRRSSAVTFHNIFRCVAVCTTCSENTNPNRRISLVFNPPDIRSDRQASAVPLPLRDVTSHLRRKKRVAYQVLLRRRERTALHYQMPVRPTSIILSSPPPVRRFLGPTAADSKKKRSKDKKLTPSFLLLREKLWLRRAEKMFQNRTCWYVRGRSKWTVTNITPPSPGYIFVCLHFAAGMLFNSIQPTNGWPELEIPMSDTLRRLIMSCKMCWQD